MLPTAMRGSSSEASKGSPTCSLVESTASMVRTETSVSAGMMTDVLRLACSRGPGSLERELSGCVEMAQEVGEENFFLFDLTASQAAGSRGWYNPHWHYEH